MFEKLTYAGNRENITRLSADRVAARAGADGGDERGGLHAAVASALDVGGVEPDVEVLDVGEVAFLQVGDSVVQRRAHPGHLAGAHTVYAHGLRHALHLPGGHAVSHHLGDGGDDRSVHARVALDQVLGEVAAGTQLRDPEVDDAHAGGEPALALAVPLVAGLACLVGLGAHDLVDERLGHHPNELGHVHHAVIESRHLGAVARNLVYLVHIQLLAFYESRLQQLEFQAIPASCFLRPGKRTPAPAFGTRSTYGMQLK